MNFSHWFEHRQSLNAEKKVENQRENLDLKDVFR